MENQLFLHLRKRYDGIYYYLTEKKHEVDFYIPEDNSLWQGTQSLSEESVKERECRALVEASEELEGSQRLVVVTFSEGGEVSYQGRKIELIPVYKLLGDAENAEGERITREKDFSLISADAA